MRAEQAAHKLQAQGLQKLVVVEGGTEAWSQRQLPIQRATVGMSLARQTQIALGLLILLMLAKGMLLHPYSFVLDDRVFTGDTLLIRGTGRTDFQNGDPGAQYDS